MAFATVDAAKIHYRLTGSGSPMVLLLPQSRGPDGRDALVDALSSRHRVLTFDPRGTGQSDPAPPGQDIASLARDVLGLMDELALAPAHLVCHSTGCGIGQSVAATEPANVMSLVLAAPWTHGDEFLREMQELRKAAARSLDPVQYAHFNAALLFPPAFRRARQAGFARLAAGARDSPHDARDIARRLDAILAFDARALWRSIHCPTLVITGADDQLMPGWFAQDTATAIRGARLMELDGGGHMLPETRTAQFTSAVLEFITEIEGPADADG